MKQTTEGMSKYQVTDEEKEQSSSQSHSGSFCLYLQLLGARHILIGSIQKCWCVAM